MRKTTHLIAGFAVLLVLAACAREEAEQMEMATAEALMVLPVTTSSSSAMEEFMAGQRALDVGRFYDARDHFKKAVAADPAFAHAYLNLANTATSLDEYQANLNLAAENAATASEAERLLIEIAQRGFKNDVEGQLELAQKLTDLESMSPRAWLALADVQGTLGRNEEARTTMMKATELAPNFAPAYMMLGNSFLFSEPRDLAKAQTYMEKVVALEPNEPLPHDFLGDCYRAQGQLEKAAESYTRAAELDPTEGSPLQQRGHVHSFLGNYDAARADYDAAITLSEPNEKASFGIWRALVSVHAGEPEAAIAELNGLVTKIDGMGIPEPTGIKISALTNVAVIAAHHKMFSAAEEALTKRSKLMMEEADRVGTEEFRRGQKANIALFDGFLAARKGDYKTGTAKAQEFMTLLEPDRNPRKNEPAHALLGQIDLWQGDYEKAISHFQQASPEFIYNTYYLALAYEGAGNMAKAKELFGKVANYNFNNAWLALVRKDAIKKAT